MFSLIDAFALVTSSLCDEITCNRKTDRVRSSESDRLDTKMREPKVKHIAA